MVPFSTRLHEALDFAAIHHNGQDRKDPDIRIPYLSHLFGVAYILAHYGFDEDVVVAGVLHDFIEDVVEKKKKPELGEEMRRRFGETVYTLVGYVTQQKTRPDGSKIEWHERGETYRQRLCAGSTPAGAKAISAADKIHNIESLLMGLERHAGREEKMWGKLKATPREQLNKFIQLRDGLRAHWSHPILDELDTKIEALSRGIPA